MSKVKTALASVLAGVLGFVIGAVPAAVPTQPLAPVAATGTVMQYYGVVRVGPTGWTILNNTTHTPHGLASANCKADTGELEVFYTVPLISVGTSSATPDEAYAGRIEVGASVGLVAIYIAFRNASGTPIHCNSSALLINNSNVWVLVIGIV